MLLLVLRHLGGYLSRLIYATSSKPQSIVDLNAKSLSQREYGLVCQICEEDARIVNISLELEDIVRLTIILNGLAER